jgi:protein SCO1/2
MMICKSKAAQFWKYCSLLPWLAFLVLGFAGTFSKASSHAGTTNYLVHGVLKAIRADQQKLVIAHEEIPNFMEAMTMPFRVKDAAILTNVAIGRKISFQLHVTETESWVDDIQPLDTPESSVNRLPTLPKSDSHSEVKTNSAAATVHTKNPLRDYKFTNELGKPVSLSDFRGQAIALTFFFTRCPIPEYCPRLSRNFEETQSKLKAMENAPTNWHLLSVTFDPERDSPEVLKAYGASYKYDPAHWSFLTGPKEKIAELARLCDVNFDPDNGSFNHNFRTLIINSSNQLQMVFPTSGDLADSIVQELIKAAGGTNQITKSASSNVR